MRQATFLAATFLAFVTVAQAQAPAVKKAPAAPAVPAAKTPTAPVAKAPAAPVAKSAVENLVDPTIIKELIGTWENQVHSKLRIKDIDPKTGAITGTYQTLKDDGTTGEEFPLTGCVNTAKPDKRFKSHVVPVSFTVRWGDIGTITAWNGYYGTYAGSPAIVAQWFLSKPNSGFDWDHFLTGQDQFHK